MTQISKTLKQFVQMSFCQYLHHFRIIYTELYVYLGEQIEAVAGTKALPTSLNLSH